jgi:hypothetical protein
LTILFSNLTLKDNSNKNVSNSKLGEIRMLNGFKTVGLSLGLSVLGTAINLMPASALSLGQWQFTIDALGSDPGGVLVADIITDDPIGDPASILKIQETFKSNLTNIAEPIHLIATGYQTSGTAAQGGTKTTNQWLSPTPIPNNGVHLDSGGFAFYYGAETSTPASDDIYQVFHASGSYQGCWGTGSCQPIHAISVPWETDALPVIGSTIAFGAGLFAKRKMDQAKTKTFKLDA